jgi:hypothetical protein
MMRVREVDVITSWLQASLNMLSLPHFTDFLHISWASLINFFYAVIYGWRVQSSGFRPASKCCENSGD